jgi:hypothetical protein
MNPDEAVLLRTYGNEVEASVAASILGSEGIETYIEKADCGGAYPSLQMTEGVRLLVKPEDREEADRILKEGESRELQPEDRSEPGESSTKRKSNPFLLAGMVVLGFIAGFIVVSHIKYRSHYEGTIKEAYNQAGKPGRFLHYVDGQLVRWEEDRNYDGEPDAWFRLVNKEVRSSSRDNNFDGKPDVWVEIKDEFNYVERVDTDFDGKPDATIFYVNSLMHRVDWHPKDSPNIQRRVLYEHGVLKEELIDTDGDGIFDQRITYDPYGKPIEKTSCWIRN